MDVATEQLWYMRSLLDDPPFWMNGRDTVRAFVRAVDPVLQLFDAGQYIWAYARRQGYDIPAYPMDPAGEVREFLADAGATDVPSWYASIGVDAQTYAHLGDYRLLVARDADFRRQALLLPARAFDDFVPLAAADDVLLRGTVRYALDFALERTDVIRGKLFT